MTPGMIRCLGLFQSLLAVIAVAGYIANGAQSHLTQHAGDTLSLPMCSGNAPRIVQLGGDPAPIETADETCCGDCTSATALEANFTAQLDAPIRYTVVQSYLQPTIVHPRSPLWPGAPPQGPPTAHTA